MNPPNSIECCKCEYFETYYTYFRCSKYRKVLGHVGFCSPTTQCLVEKGYKEKKCIV